MVSVVNASGEQDIDGLLWGWKWDFTSFTFSFPTDPAEYTGYEAINGFAAFNAAQQDAVRTALASIAGFTPLTFTETTAAHASLRFAELTTVNYSNDSNDLIYTGLHTPGNSSAEANPPELPFGGTAPASAVYAQGDAWFNHADYNNPRPGNFAYAAGIIHELGHNLGLKHGHVTQDGHGHTFPALPADHDSQEYSIMTYRQYPGDNPNTDTELEFATTYMQDDIAALQYLYGANYNHNSGNSTYTWSPTTGEMFINGVGQGAPTRNAILMTVWDGGGNDTYDLSNYTADVTIDLNPGQWSTFAPGQLANLGGANGGPDFFARGSVANAQLYQGNTASLIENAIGGPGNDTIYGNEIANHLQGGGGTDLLKGGGGNDFLEGQDGNDTLIGEEQNDTVSGGAGNDAFVLNAPSNGVDTYLDLSSVDHDQIWLSWLDYGLSGAGTLADNGVDFVYGPAARSAAPTLRYDHGDLYWDADGTGAQASVLVAHVQGITADMIGAGCLSGSGWSVVATGDFDNNGSTDILWENNADRSVAGWLMASGTAASTPSYLSADGWSVAATGDFNNDGTTDILWKNGADGATGAWFMAGGAIASHPVLYGANGWDVVATGDFDHNGTDDILWKNAGNGGTAVWLMGGGGIAGSAFLSSAAGWNAVASGDFNGDGTTDVLWKRAADGSTGAWLMAGGTAAGTPSLLNANGWSIAATGDFNHDGTTDIVWKNDTDGATGVWLMGGGGVAGTALLLGAAGWDVAVVGDFNSDGTDDLLWRNVNDGSTAAWLISGGAVAATAFFESADGYRAIAHGDFNRDGTTDVLWQSAANGSVVDWQFSHVTAQSLLVV